MRSFSRSQFGSTNWAFVITLLLLLVFVWMWYDETDKQDKMTADLRAAKERAAALNEEGWKIAEAYETLSKSVGWRSKTVTLDKISGPRDHITVTDTNAVKTHANPDGVVAGGADGAGAADGLLKQLIAESFLVFERTARLHATKTGEESEVKYETLTAAFKGAPQLGHDRARRHHGEPRPCRPPIPTTRTARPSTRPPTAST